MSRLQYRFMNLYSAIAAPTPYQGITGLATTGLPNPNVQWEETNKNTRGNRTWINK